MTLKAFLQLLRRNAFLILGCGLLAAVAAYLLVSRQKQEYTSRAVISTGIVSSVSIKNPDSGVRVDRDYTHNEMENLISLATAHRTYEELATHLLATYLQMEEADLQWITGEEFTELREEVFTEELRAYRDSTADATLVRLTQACQEVASNPVKEIIYSDQAYFGVDYLEERLNVYRRGTSDLLQFSYSTTDPMICKQTLAQHLELFFGKQQQMKKNQSSEVVEYFASAVKSAADRLESSEQGLLNFRVQNKIINFNEQTRTIAIRREDLEELRFKENMALEGTEATRARVEAELGNREKLSEINEAMLSMREELTLISEQLAKMEIATLSNPKVADPARKLQLENRQTALRQAMSQYARDAFEFEQSPNGLQTQKLLDEWLATIVAEEQGKARLGVIESRREEFEGIYSQYAPWGSQLKELEREISLAEDEYLENLHSYNQALLHKQHSLMTNHLEVIDEPYVPIEHVDWKRLLLVALAFFGGAGMVLALLIMLAFMDDSLQTPAMVQEKTGLEVATVLPRITDKGGRKVQARREGARQQALALLLQQIKVETLQKDVYPKLVLVTSTRREEGKSWLCTQTANALRAEENRVLYLSPLEGGVLPVSGNADNKGYELNSRMLDAEYMRDLPIFGDVNLSSYHYVLLEIPALLSGKYPLAVLKQFDLTLLLCRADRSWETADSQALKTLQRATRSPIRTVLNGASMDTLQIFMGELSDQSVNVVPDKQRALKPEQYN